MFEASRMATANHRIFGSTPIPRYVQLAELIRQRVAKGHWPAGSLLPSIEHLMTEFDVARVTVRQAIALLADGNILSPQRGRGTFITARPGAPRRRRVETTLDDLLARYAGEKPDHATLAKGISNPVLTEMDGIAAPKYHNLRRVHSRNGERYCAISIYIDHRVFRANRFRRELALPVLTSLRGMKIAAARRTLTISSVDVETSRLLRLRLNAPGGRGAAGDVRSRPHGDLSGRSELSRRGYPWRTSSRNGGGSKLRCCRS
jgi:GntR family transcriptional regulator